jgi:hypothetical protein
MLMSKEVSKCARVSHSSRALAPKSTETRQDRLRAHAQPVVEIALRPEVLWGNEHAPASPEHPRKREGPVGCVAFEGNVHAAGPPKQRQPRRLPAAGAVKPARAGVPEHGQRVGNPLTKDHRSQAGITALYISAEESPNVIADQVIKLAIARSCGCPSACSWPALPRRQLCIT